MAACGIGPLDPPFVLAGRRPLKPGFTARTPRSRADIIGIAVAMAAAVLPETRLLCGDVKNAAT